jgi:uncharacterized membrane protein YhaH (DUF805 family)
VNWYLEVLKKYTVFTGRARRKEYWFFVLFNVLILVLLVVVDGLLGTLNEEAGVGLFSGLYSLAVLIPGIAVLVRRLHDIDRTGWWALIGLVPFVGGIVLLVLAALDSTPGENRFGPNPKLEQA